MLGTTNFSKELDKILKKLYKKNIRKNEKYIFNNPIFLFHVQYIFSKYI